MNRSVKLNAFAQRAVLIAAALLCVTAVYFAVRWYFANTLAANTDSKEIAQYAIDLAPRDPQAHYMLAALNERTFLADDLRRAQTEYEQAVSVTPYDFRYWFDLGKARERSGDSAGAEKALRKALQFAPNYSRIHWTLGNLLLREGNTEEAFIEIRRAVENDPSYANPAVSIAWDFFEGDVTTISQKIGDSDQIKSALALFLANRSRYDEAFNLWNSLPETDRKTIYAENGKNIAQILIAAKKYRDALAIQTEINPSDTEKFEPERFSNGGFETNSGVNDANSILGWKIADGTQPQIGFDDQQKHGGNRSLVVLFNSPTGRDFRNLQQTIAVAGGKQYSFETFVRSNLKSSATVRWEIVDTADDKVLASTAAVPENSEWMPLSAEFTTPPSAQAITIRLARIPCASTLCPITGKVWFDDFNLR